MTLTTSYISQKFNLYNKLYFKNEINIVPNFKIIHGKTTLGQFSWKRNIANQSCKYTISVSDYYDRTEKQYDNTIIHEMIHMYLMLKYKRDMKHGYEFKAECHRINTFGWNLSRCTDTSSFKISAKNKAKIKQTTSIHIGYFKETCGTYFLFGINDKYINYYENEMSKHPTLYGDYNITTTSREDLIQNLPKCHGGIRGRRFSTKEDLLKSIN